MTNWDKRFIDLANHIATWSKDTNTKTGAVIVDKDNRVISMGYNGFPSGAVDTREDKYEKPQKYFYTEHAERNAIYNAAKLGISTDGCTMYIMWFPCADCARAIIQSGIKKLVCHEPDLNLPKWGEHFEKSLEMFNEVNMKIVYID